METISHSHPILRFGVFEVDLRTSELHRHGVRIRLEEQPFQILSVLLESPGELVTREDLRRRLWSADTFVDFDRGLNKAISKLRLALGDSAENPRFIETLHRRGYRFIAPVQHADKKGDSAMHQSAPSIEQPIPPSLPKVVEHPEPVRQRTARNLNALAAAIAVAAVIISVPFYLHWRQSTAFGSSTPNPMVPRRSVAVLGFKNLSRSADQAWISTALSDWLTTELSAGEQLRTIPAESVARMKIELSLPDTESLSSASLSRIGNNLGTDLVIVGSYADMGGRYADRQVRLDLRLQNTRSGETLDAISETGSEAHLFELVSHAGEHLRRKLRVEAITGRQAAEIAVALPGNHDAAKLYSEGQSKLRVFDALAARDLFEKAVSIEPTFALSHAALAEAWATLGYDENARAEAKRAYDLSNNLPRAERLLVEGRYYETSKNWDKAIQIYRALFAFFPDSLDYGLALAQAQVNSGTGKDALETVDALKKLPPPLGDDPRLDLAEARAAESLGDFKMDLAATSKAAEKAKALGASLLLAQAEADRAWALDNLGPLEDALRSARVSQHLFAAAGDKRGEAQAATVGAIALGLQGDTLGAKRVYEQSLAIYREMGDKRGVGVELNNIADQLLSLGDPIGARREFEESLDTYREIGHQDGVAMAKSNLGGVLLELGDSEGARKMYEESLEICRKIGDRSKAAGDLAGFGAVTRTAGELEQARTYLAGAMSEFVNIGDKSSAAEVEISLAEVLLDQKKISEAVKMAGSAADEFGREKAPRDEALAEGVLARALLAQGDVAEAQKAIQAATALSQKFHDRQVELSVDVNAARVRVAAGSARERATAVNHLQKVLAEATRRGFVSASLDVRLALGEIEIASDNRSARNNLETLRKDANEKGFRWIAQQANAALQQASLHQ